MQPSFISFPARSASLLALCLAAGVLTGCAQSGRSTLGGPSDPASVQERQRSQGSIHPVPPNQGMPGAGEAFGSGAGAGDARQAPGRQ